MVEAQPVAQTSTEEQKQSQENEIAEAEPAITLVRDADEEQKQSQENEIAEAEPAITLVRDAEEQYKGVLGGLLTIEIIKNDITRENVDAITNAANSGLYHGGGVAGAISRNGGPTI